MPLPPPVNVGLAPNDGKGDPNRTAFQKTNARDEYLDQRITSVSTLTLASGTTTTLPPGSPATASLSGTSPNYTLDLGLPAGIAGAGAPTSPDILAVAEMARLERALSAAGVPDEASLILDFTRGVHFASKTAITASILTLIAALPGSSFARASTATYFDKDGLMKTAAVNVPRIDYDPATRLPRGFLIENQARTNLFTYSEQIDNAVWIKSRATVVADAGLAASGAMTADKLVEDASNGNHILIQSVTTGSGEAHTVSHYVRAAGRSNVRIQLDDGNVSFASASFDLAAGTYSGLSGSGSRAKITSCGGDLWRIELTGISTSTIVREVFYLTDLTGITSYTGDGSSGVYLSGAQLEVGAGASSYIPTTASTVTRAADALTIGGKSWINSAALSGAVEFSLNAARSTGTSSAIYLRNAPNTSNTRVREGAAILGADLTTASTSPQIDTSSYSAPLATAMRFAFGIDAGTWAFAKDNVLSYTGGATTPPVDLDYMIVGENGFMGHIRRILFFPQRLLNAKVQALSNQSLWS